MKNFKSVLKAIVKGISGYELQWVGRGGLALARENIDMQRLLPRSILLMEKTHQEVQGSRGIYDYLCQLRLKTILEKYRINLVLDVGANEGQFATGLRAMGYEGRIISFEPIPKVFEILKKAAADDPNWEVQQIALGKESKEQTINVADSSNFSSFLESRPWSQEYYGKALLTSREETVFIRRLDEVLGEAVENLETARIYLKLDTQGYDLEVFLGVGSIRNSIVAMQSEISVVPIYEGMPHLTDSISFFEEAGFAIAGMYPVSTEKHSLRLIEFDCLMVDAQRL
jgi:FkbM family methyltransferase